MFQRKYEKHPEIGSRCWELFQGHPFTQKDKSATLVHDTALAM